MGLNPAVYWMDVSYNGSFYIVKIAKGGTPKKVHGNVNVKDNK
jgi:hypothetical protein